VGGNFTRVGSLAAMRCALERRFVERLCYGSTVPSTSRPCRRTHLRRSVHSPAGTLQHVVRWNSSLTRRSAAHDHGGARDLERSTHSRSTTATDRGRDLHVGRRRACEPDRPLDGSAWTSLSGSVGSGRPFSSTTTAG
jgi:hypothetical protein